MTIPFNGISTSIRVPGVYTEFDNSRASQGVAVLPKRLLLIGAMLSSGTATAGARQQILGPTDGDALFGRGTQLTKMIRKAKLANPLVEMWAVGAVGAGTAETRTLTFTGTSTAAGVVHLYIDGEYIPVQIPSGSNATAVALAVDTELAILEPDRMWTAAPAAGVVTLTCRHLSAIGADSDVRVNAQPRQQLPTGITLVIAVGVAGATNPSIATALANMGATWFTDIALGYNDSTNIGLAEAELEIRMGPTVQQDGTVYAAQRGLFSAVDAIGAARNSRVSNLMGTSTALSPPWEWSAVLAAIVANEDDPARPLQTLALPGIQAAAGSALFTFSERNLLLFDGISTHHVDDAGNVSIERMITTYQTNTASVEDRSYLNLETMKTLAYLRYSQNQRFRLKYPRAKLVNDGTKYSAGQSIMTPKIARGELIQLFEEWESAVLVEDPGQFINELIVERNASDPDRLDVRMGPNLANQFRVFAGQIQFLS